MSDQDYIYGVYESADNVPQLIARLHQAGMQTSEICVLGNKSEQFRQVAGKIEDPFSKHFIAFGVGGALAGLIAGICVSLHIPGVNGFQLIVPLMGTVSGGACFPYFICQLAAFLSSNRPQHWASVFEGTVNAGAVIVMAEPQSRQQRQSAMDILLSNHPVEMIFRRTPWGVSATDTPEMENIETDVAQTKGEKEKKLTAVA